MLSNVFTKAALYGIEQPAAFLRYTAAGTYTLSTLAQAGGLYINNKIPEKEKDFLILQELINGALQLTTFMTIATAFENYGKRLAGQGKIVGYNLAKDNPVFKKGIAVLFSVAGTVLAFNIITPLLRNPIAHFLQKHFKKDLTPEQNDLTRPVIPSIKLNSYGQLDANSPFIQFQNALNTNTLPDTYFDPVRLPTTTKTFIA